MATGLKSVREAQVGDTITTVRRAGARSRCPATRKPRAWSSPGIYPVSGEDYPLLRDALEKLHLNDASFTYEPESSVALGFGFRCGFLGLLHMEIVQERLEREFDLDLIASAPVGRIRGRAHERPRRRSSRRQPGPAAARLRHRGDPRAVGPLSVVTPATYIGPLMELSTEPARELHRTSSTSTRPRVLMRLRAAARRAHRRLLRPAEDADARAMPRWTTRRPGTGPRSSCRLDVLVNGEPVDALSIIVPPRQCPALGRTLAERLKAADPAPDVRGPDPGRDRRNIVARETVRAMRKNVLAKCYGGDITRKRKLLEKQKEGKKRMKRVGSVEIPQEAFLAMLRSWTRHSVDEA